MIYIIAATYQRGQEFAKASVQGDYTIITPSDRGKEKLMGVTISSENLVVVGDPAMRYSFWEVLVTRLEA